MSNEPSDEEVGYQLYLMARTRRTLRWWWLNATSVYWGQLWVWVVWWLLCVAVGAIIGKGVARYTLSMYRRSTAHHRGAPQKGSTP